MIRWFFCALGGWHLHGNELMNCKLDQKETSKFWLPTHPRCGCCC